MNLIWEGVVEDDNCTICIINYCIRYRCYEFNAGNKKLKKDSSSIIYEFPKSEYTVQNLDILLLLRRLIEDFKKEIIEEKR